MNKIVTLIVAVGALVAGVMLFGQLNKKANVEFALHYQQARDVKPFELTDHLGNTFNNASLKEHWSWMFFGYTSCPDVCPTTLQEMNFIYDELKAIANNSQVLLVSVDPKRDTQEKLASYIGYFNPEFKALHGDHGTLFPFARNLGLMYAITESNGDDHGQTVSNYLVDHSASLVLINPAGKVEAIFKPKQALGEVPVIEGDKLVSDFAKIVALY
ncbi:SCO family protein [Colwellia sp. M166]|uniref:SCO family protein n=1 Tax=Colwellia sp. M166 TaxID=2583805 RepID=UPI00211ECDE2|nr:SCO family protein [Colwellia sp. M166]UUO23910.1 SCO family protein [Colwellia sp. M166]|tara:strand:+ start:12486 stop:13130 length:645 start_codon:yes stop_codon:yes gene_type:complete